MVGMGCNALFGCKDVQIDPNKRGTMLQDWGQEHRSGVVETFTLARGGVRAEGVGINHEEWAKKKKEYLRKQRHLSETLVWTKHIFPNMRLSKVL
jgi:hypothetical protein